MKYIKQDAVAIRPIEFYGNEYYQIGTDDWNIVVGLGGLIEIMTKVNKIYTDKLNEED